MNITPNIENAKIKPANINRYELCPIKLKHVDQNIHTDLRLSD